MKKNYIKIAVFLFLISLVIFGGLKYEIYNFKYKSADKLIFINTQFEKNSDDYKKLKHLAKQFDKTEFKAVIYPANKHKSGKYNLYVINDSSSLPKVIDLEAINILWLPYVFDDDIEKYRDFDVIVVKSSSSFEHLKAINVRTAFIPDAIDMKKIEKKTNNRVLYYGDYIPNSLVMYLTRNYDIDIIGKGWEKSSVKNKVIKNKISKDDFAKYLIVLVDQTDKEIAKNLINKNLITVLENGGFPFIRLNPGVGKLFDARIAMYFSEQDFHDTMHEFMRNKSTIKYIKNSLYAKLDEWDSLSVANKLAEIFQIMQKKRIN